jgi:hypothetical protein
VNKPHLVLLWCILVVCICSSNMRCGYCVAKTSHPLFVYLASEQRTTHNGSRIGVATHPMQRINPHNRAKGWLRLNVKSTKYGEGSWRLELIIGPFWNGGAAAFARSWSMAARKLSRRIVIGINMSKNEEQLAVYARNWRYVRRQLDNTK